MLGGVWLLFGCETPPGDVVIDGSVAGVAVELVNPTSCSDCDPFAGIDALELQVLVDGEAVATETWSYPAESISLPDLDGFGVVRIVLFGLSGGAVYSAGRTPLISLAPGEDRQVAMTFLPVNRALPVTGDMVSPRSRHAAWRRHDGKVLLLGGLAPDRRRGFTGTETWDPDVGRFVEATAELPGEVGDPVLDPQDDGTVFLVGGVGPEGGGSVLTAVYDDNADTVVRTGDMVWPRSGHCVSRYLSTQGMVFGGTSSTDQADYFRLDEAGSWSFAGVVMLDFDQAGVSGCATLPDGRTFVQGLSASATGIWDYTEERVDGYTAGNAFDAVAGGQGRTGPTLQRLDDGRVWILGGAPDGGDAVSSTRFFSAEGDYFEEGQAMEARRAWPKLDRWISGDWYAVGCGWEDAGRETPADSLELIDPVSARSTELVGFDRSRDGCAISVLRDGAVLVSGGFAEGEDDEPGAALVVPWFGELD